VSSTLKLYNRVSKLPMGNFLFSKALAFRAPYFSSIKPLITELRSGFCRVEMNDRRSVRNHIGSINAGAMCTLSELTGGLAVESSIAPILRWIPKEMTVRYSKKATGKLTGICAFDPAVLKPGNITIPFEIQDETGDAVLKTDILFYISERKVK
jgi:acyl-coenzyme A thioesterase PaaI-like protein